MICEKCKQPMIKGYIPTWRGKLMWIPEEEVPPLINTNIPRGGVQLSQWPIMAAKRAVSYHCSNCKTVLTPYK